MGLHVVLVVELPLEFHCALYLQDRSRNANGIASGAGGGVAAGFLTEVSGEMRFE